MSCCERLHRLVLIFGLSMEIISPWIERVESHKNLNKPLKNMNKSRELFPPFTDFSELEQLSKALPENQLKSSAIPHQYSKALLLESKQKLTLWNHDILYGFGFDRIKHSK
jgi:hypothetical protein